MLSNKNQLLKAYIDRFLISTIQLSAMNTTQNVQFDVAGTLGGIINNGIKPGENKCLQCKPFVRRTVSMECFPLFSILQALGNPTVKRPRAFRLWPLLSLTNLIFFSFPAFFRIHSS